MRRGTRGYVIIQRPGETLAHAGGFDIAACPPAELGRTVIGLLPEAVAGRDAAAVREELADAGNEPYAGDDVGPAVAPAAALTDCGFVKVIQGHLGFRARDLVEEGLAWRDVPGDGRYAITVGEPIDTATGMDSAAQADWVDAQMAHIMTRLST